MAESRILADFRGKIRNKQLKIAIIGLGYVGFPLALEFAKKGIKVLGIEIDQSRLKSIANKSSYISDITDNELKSALAGLKITAG